MNHHNLRLFEAFNIATSSGEPLTFVEYLLRAGLLDAISRGGSLGFPWPLSSPAPA